MTKTDVLGALIRVHRLLDHCPPQLQTLMRTVFVVSIIDEPKVLVFVMLFFGQTIFHLYAVVACVCLCV